MKGFTNVQYAHRLGRGTHEVSLCQSVRWCFFVNYLSCTRVNPVLVNIKPVEFQLIRLCSFCNIYMSNDVKFFETPCILLLYIIAFLTSFENFSYKVNLI